MKNSIAVLAWLLGGISFVTPGAAQDAPAGDPAAGEKSFAKCRPCHMIGENAKNGVGPILNGVIGRAAGSVAGYNYSAANRDSGLTWNDATFLEYIAAPQAKIKGTKMAFAGIKDPKEAANLLAYLKQFDASGKKN
ncbi:MAG: c-type cytochrome [Beijerinckiaceae bacterium]